MTLGYHHLLAPLDGSELAEQALPHAQAIAQRAGARITLLQVIPNVAALAQEPALPPGRLTAALHTQALQSQWQEQALAALEQTAQSLAGQGVMAQAAVVVAHPPDGILDYAQTQAVDLIVMSTHGRSGLARWVYGSVAARVVQAAPCPVLLIRTVAGQTTPAPRKILVTLDGSGLSTRALPEAERLARLFKAEIVLLHVVADSYEQKLRHVPPSLAPEVAAYTSNMLERRIAQVTVEQEGIAADLQARGVAARSAVLTGDPVQTILDYAASESVELIAMATHGRSGMARMLHGSVAERVLHDTPCPLLLVHATA